MAAQFTLDEIMAAQDTPTLTLDDIMNAEPDKAKDGLPDAEGNVNGGGLGQFPDAETGDVGGGVFSDIGRAITDIPNAPLVQNIINPNTDLPAGAGVLDHTLMETAKGVRTGLVFGALAVGGAEALLAREGTRLVIEMGAKTGGLLRSNLSSFVKGAAASPAAFIAAEAGAGGAAGAAGANIDNPYYKFAAEMAASIGSIAAFNKVRSIIKDYGSLHQSEKELVDAVRHDPHGVGNIQQAERDLQAVGVDPQDAPLNVLTGNANVTTSGRAVAEKDIQFGGAIDQKNIEFTDALKDANAPRMSEEDALGMVAAAKAQISDAADNYVELGRQIDAQGGAVGEVSQELFSQVAALEKSAHTAASDAFTAALESTGLAAKNVALLPIKKAMDKVSDATMDSELLGTTFKKYSNIIGRADKKADVPTVILDSSGDIIKRPKQPALVSLKDLHELRSNISSDIAAIRVAAGGGTPETVKLGEVEASITKILEKNKELKGASDTWREYSQTFHAGTMERFFRQAANGELKLPSESFMRSYILSNTPIENAATLRKVKRYDEDGTLSPKIDGMVRKGFLSILKAKQEGGQLTPSVWAKFVSSGTGGYGQALKEYGLLDEFKQFKNVADEMSGLDVSQKVLDEYGFSAATKGADLDTAIQTAFKAKGGGKKLIDGLANTPSVQAVVRDRFMQAMIGLDANGAGLPNPATVLGAVNGNSAAISREIGEGALQASRAMSNILTKAFGEAKGYRTQLAQQPLVKSAAGWRKFKNTILSQLASTLRKVVKGSEAISDVVASERALTAFVHAYTDPVAAARIKKFAIQKPDEFKASYMLAFDYEGFMQILDGEKQKWVH